MENERIFCSHCNSEIEEDENYETIDDKIVCSDCVARYTTTCDCCGTIIWESDAYGDEEIDLCSHCYQTHYTTCCHCDALLHRDDAYHLNGYDYCYDCYHEETEDDEAIHEYSYKPEPIFYGESGRYFGVELEIDGAGVESENADEILNIGNANGEHIYIKSDGSLNEGMEIVSHPMSLDFHKSYCWDRIMRKAVELDYRSHQTATCGLHVHVNRTAFGSEHEEQESVISRILYFVEHHWNELLRFSRRSESSMNRWAARYGYESSPKAILDKAKKGNNGRYAAINLLNYSTIEFRLFRGTLKYNTFIATLELVDMICDLACELTDEEMQALSWSELVTRIKEPELIQYLKERNLYVNDEVNAEEDY